MAAERNETPAPAPRRSGAATTPPPVGEENDDERIVFTSWDAPLVPGER